MQPRPEARRASREKPFTNLTPTPGQELIVNIHGGNCDALVSLPGFPRISQVGNDIRIVYFSFHSDDIEFCNFDVGTAHLPVAGQPAGSYTYTIARVYLDPTNQEVEERPARASSGKEPCRPRSARPA